MAHGSELAVLLGASGSGKSALLNILGAASGRRDGYWHPATPP
jgi:ABC-type lipoprotein export system ATPase subunit